MRSIIFWSLILLSINTFAQKLPDMGLYKIRIVTPEKNITAEIKPVNSEPEIESNRFYNWYSSNHISQTQGGYSGTLLNGAYSEYYFNKSLKQQGEFKKGLRNGVWKDWTEAGVLISVVNWSDGLKQGEFQLFDEKGIIKQTGNYKKGLLNGKQHVYNQKGDVEVSVYKDGNLLPVAAPKKFWTRINIFRKKH